MRKYRYGSFELTRPEIEQLTKTYKDARLMDCSNGDILLRIFIMGEFHKEYRYIRIAIPEDNE